MGTARGSFLRGWRLLAIDGFEVDLPDSKENAAEFGYAGSGENRSAFPKARVVALVPGCVGDAGLLGDEVEGVDVADAAAGVPRVSRDSRTPQNPRGRATQLMA